MNEWKVKGFVCSKNLESRQTLDVGYDEETEEWIPGPRFDVEATWPIIEWTFETRGVSLADGDFLPIHQAATQRRGAVVTIPSKLGSFTGKIITYSADVSADGLSVFDATVTLRMEPPE